MKIADIECRACAAGLPLIWSVQERCMTHLAQGLSTTPCKKIEYQAQLAKDLQKGHH